MTLKQAFEKAEQRYKDMDCLEDKDAANAREAMRIIREVKRHYDDLCEWKPLQRERWELECLDVLTEHFVTIKRLYRKLTHGAPQIQP